MLRYRLIFGPLMIVLFLLVVFADQQLGAVTLCEGGQIPVARTKIQLPQGVVLAAVVAVLIVLVARELSLMAMSNGVPVGWWRLAGGALLGVSSMYLLPVIDKPSVVVGGFATAAACAVVFAILGQGVTRRSEGALSVLGVAVLSFVYLGVMPGFLLLIRQRHSAWLVAAIVLLPKVCDIGAYFVGRAIGRHKLIPWLSPGKTWEGLAGGVAVSGLVCVGLVTLGASWASEPGAHQWFGDERLWLERVPWWIAAGVGVLIGAVGQGGDLVASMLKRDTGVKDSGSSVPGFGGFLDVVDSPILVAPVAYWLLAVAAA